MITTVNINRDKHIKNLDIINMHVLGKNKLEEKRKVKYPSVLSLIDDHLYALFSTLLSRLTVLACDSTWVTSFIARFLNIHRSGVLTALAWLVPHETAAVSAQVLCAPYNHAPCHFMQSHICKVYACLAVTCHLHFWQNDRDLLRATAVTWGGGGGCYPSPPSSS